MATGMPERRAPNTHSHNKLLTAETLFLPRLRLGSSTKNIEFQMSERKELRLPPILHNSFAELTVSVRAESRVRVCVRGRCAVSSAFVLVSRFAPFAAVPRQLVRGGIGAMRPVA